MHRILAGYWSALPVLALVLATAHADNTAPGVPLEQEPRSLFNPAWLASMTVVRVFSQALEDAGPAGPERVRKLWYLTCVFDAWAAGKVAFDDVAELYGDDCARWSALPTTVMQARGDPTPNTEGKNAQMIWTAYGHFFELFKKSFPTGTPDQLHAATSCAVDCLRSKGMDSAIDASEVDGPCLRYAGITRDQMKGSRTAKRGRTR